MTSHLPVPHLRSRLEELDLPSHGRRPELQRRLRKALARIKAEEERIEHGELRDEDVDLQTWTPKFTHYLVIDVEATCDEGRVAGFGYPNEIIELPVVLLRLPPSAHLDVEPQLIDTFHTFVRPVFQPILTPFCKTLTGITQAQVDSAPTFPQALSLLYRFLCKHDLLQFDSNPPPVLTTSDDPLRSQPFLDPFSPEHRASLKRTALFCSHGPFDIRDFIPKACWINSFAYGPPVWLRRCSILDVRKAAMGLLYVEKVDQKGGEAGRLASMANKARYEEVALPALNGDVEALSTPSSSSTAERKSKHIDTTIPGLLLLLQLHPFEGQLHSGLDDTKNLARVVAELIRRVILGARSWSDQTRWDEPAEEPSQLPREQEILAEEAQKVLDGLAKVALDDGTGPQVAQETRQPPRRLLPPATPLAPHIRDQILAHNVYLPEYPSPPPLLLHRTVASDERVDTSSLSASQLLLSGRPDGPPRVSLPPGQHARPPPVGPDGSPPTRGEEATARRLLKGGSAYYPKRWAWMGKKEGQVKWDGQDQRAALDRQEQNERRTTRTSSTSSCGAAEGPVG